jgi:hypothetical protein
MVQRRVEKAHVRRGRRRTNESLSIPAKSQSEDAESSSQSAAIAFRTLVQTVRPEKIQEQVLRLFINEHMVLRTADTPDWRGLMKLLNAGDIPLSEGSLRQWAIEGFDKAKADVKTLRHQSISKIRLLLTGGHRQISMLFLLLLATLFSSSWCRPVDVSP